MLHGARFGSYWITSNEHIARQYVQLLAQFVLHACAGDRFQCDYSQPFYVVELGAGHGKLSYLLLRHLQRLLDAEIFAAGAVPRFVLIVTDVARPNVAALERHALLRPFAEAGMADFAVFNAEADTTLALRRSGVVLGAAPGAGAVRPANPVALIANYLFDSLVIDTFEHRAGALFEGRVTVRARRGHICTATGRRRGVAPGTTSRPHPIPVTAVGRYARRCLR
jgi:hypothetical protein